MRNEKRQRRNQQNRKLMSPRPFFSKQCEDDEKAFFRGERKSVQSQAE